MPIAKLAAMLLLTLQAGSTPVPPAADDGRRRPGGDPWPGAA